MLNTNIDLKNKTILVSDFIGANLVMKLLDSLDGTAIIDLDSINDYYDVSIKEYILTG